MSRTGFYKTLFAHAVSLNLLNLVLPNEAGETMIFLLTSIALNCANLGKNSKFAEFGTTK
jgi:hypothetical protein